MRKTVCCFLAVSLLALITACGNTREDAPAESSKPAGQAESSAVTEENTHVNEEIETNSTGAESGTLQEGKNDMAETGVFNLREIWIVA